MEEGYPQQIYYLTSNPKKSITYQQLYEEYLDKYTKIYKIDFCETGYKNPSQLEQDIIDLAISSARKEFEENQKCPHIIKREIVYDSEYARVHKSIIENRKDFIKWLDEPKKPKLPELRVECVCGSTFFDKSEYGEHIKKCKWYYIANISIIKTLKNIWDNGVWGK